MLLACFLGACSEAPQVLSEKDTGTVIELTKGERVLIELESNPTTGFSWTASELDYAVLQPSGESTFTMGSGPDGPLGAGGMETLAFQAVERGETSLRLEYTRPFERGSLPAKVLRYDFKVQ